MLQGKGEGTEPGAVPHAPGRDIKAVLGLGASPGASVVRRAGCTSGLL